MLINVNQTLKNLDGVTLKDTDGQGDAVDATLKLLIVNAILAPVQKESGVEKVKKYELARKIYSTDETEEVNLSVEEVSLIKDRIADVYPLPLLVGQAFKMLEI